MVLAVVTGLVGKLFLLVPDRESSSESPMESSSQSSPAEVDTQLMAARVSQVEGQRAGPSNFLLMHTMGPNVAGVIGTAMVAGYFIATLGV